MERMRTRGFSSQRVGWGAGAAGSTHPGAPDRARGVQALLGHLTPQQMFHKRFLDVHAVFGLVPHHIVGPSITSASHFFARGAPAGSA
jgi:hypothetical protein